MKRPVLAFLAVMASATASFAAGVTHHIALHISQDDPAVMNMVLNNAQNVSAYYAEQGDEVDIELVAYGPGLKMLVDGTSPVADRISAMSLEIQHMTFAACANTLAGMEKKAGHPIKLMSEATVVPSGVVRLVELQELGYAYVRP
ncbi:hypothetical protein [Defluviimonas sp. SAOS-178_SWC]|uniref:DsrE family protein n=1 Tax=Defluviimonas sp. SAOS-178_SWC TaxID=3121287 RepID=UPI00322163CE